MTKLSIIFILTKTNEGKKIVSNKGR